jgi:tripartite ATP-independent transporter DctM subunit
MTDELPIAGTRSPAEARSGALTAIDHVSRFTGLSVSQFYLFCAAITVYEVFARYVLNAPTLWAFEMVMVMCAMAWLMSSGYVTLNRRHIAITVLQSLASPSTRWWLDLAGYVIGFIALFTLAYACLEPALEAIQVVERSGSSFNAPEPMVLKVGLFVAVVLYALQSSANFMRHVESAAARTVIAALTLLCMAGLIGATLHHYLGDNVLSAATAMPFRLLEPVTTFGSMIDVKSIPIGTVTLAIVLGLFALMLTGTPLGVVTLIISIIVAVLYYGTGGLFLVSSNVYGLLESYPLVAVPLFVMMSSILERSGLAKDLFDAMSVFAGNLRGGVAVQTTVVAVILAAMTGIMGGELVMLGLVALPQMLRLGYDRKLSLGLICAAGSLATLIPPSVIMIVYGLAAKVALGDLFLAGFLPGLLLATLYVVYVLVRVNLDPSLAPTAAELGLKGEKVTMSSDRLRAVFACLALIGGVMGSIYGGIASVTEAAGVGVIGALIVAWMRGKATWDMLQDVLRQTMSTVGSIIWLVLGAVSLVGIYNLIGGASFLKGVFTGLDVHPLVVIAMMMGILVILGTFMEWIAIVFITVPIFAPVVVDLAPKLGMEPEWVAVWFGILFVMNMQIYYLSPPFGPACFWLKSVTPPDVTLQEIFRSVLPFIALQIIGLALVFIFPEIALYLPKLLK